MLEKTRFVVISDLIKRQQVFGRHAATPEERLTHAEVEVLLIETLDKWVQMGRAVAPAKRRKALATSEVAE